MNIVLNLWQVGDNRILLGDITEYYRFHLDNHETWYNHRGVEKPIHWLDHERAKNFLAGCRRFTSEGVTYHVMDNTGVDDETIKKALIHLKEKKTTKYRLD